MRTLSMHIVSYLIEYLGEFELIFETILDYESADQMGSFDAKKTPSKISCLGTFKLTIQTEAGPRMRFTLPIQITFNVKRTHRTIHTRTLTKMSVSGYQAKINNGTSHLGVMIIRGGRSAHGFR